MKLLITDTNGANAVLIADHADDQPAGMALSRSVDEQIQKFLRASSARVVSRGNAICEISFQIRKTQATVTAAQTYWFDRPWQIPFEGALQMELEDRETTRRIPHCTINVSIDPPCGLLTVENYTVRGGIPQVGVRLRDAGGNELFDSEGNALYAWEEIK